MATATEKRAQAVAYMKSRARKNRYTQGGNRKYFFGKPDNIPGNTTQSGYSDCSSAVMKAIQAAAGINIGSNTSAQVTNRAKGLIVDQTDGYYPDESKLLPGDCLYFKGNENHALDVGHVEMYTGPNECYGHGSGTGPNKHNLKDYCKSRATSKKRYFMAIRWILDDGNPEGRRELKRGMIGADVTEMQGILVQLGYSLGSYGIDGDFGGDTEDAVKAFQVNNYLPETGVVDAATWAKLDLLVGNKGDVDGEVTQPEDVGTLAVRNGTWNIRTGPGTEYAIVKTTHAGDKLVPANPDGWVPIKLNGKVYWISPKALEV